MITSKGLQGRPCGLVYGSLMNCVLLSTVARSLKLHSTYPLLNNGTLWSSIRHRLALVMATSTFNSSTTTNNNNGNGQQWVSGRLETAPLQHWHAWSFAFLENETFVRS